MFTTGDVPDVIGYSSWQELMDVTAKEIQGVTSSSTSPTAEEYQQAETRVLQQAQKQSFPEDYKLFAAGKSISPSSPPWPLFLTRLLV